MTAASTTIVVDEQCNGTLKEVVSCSSLFFFSFFFFCLFVCWVWVFHCSYCLGFDSSSSGPWAVV